MLHRFGDTISREVCAVVYAVVKQGEETHQGLVLQCPITAKIPTFHFKYTFLNLASKCSFYIQLFVFYVQLFLFSYNFPFLIQFFAILYAKLLFYLQFSCFTTFFILHPMHFSFNFCYNMQVICIGNFLFPTAIQKQSYCRLIFFCSSTTDHNSTGHLYRWCHFLHFVEGRFERNI